MTKTHRIYNVSLETFNEFKEEFRNHMYDHSTFGAAFNQRFLTGPPCEVWQRQEWPELITEKDPEKAEQMILEAINNALEIQKENLSYISQFID